jgi:hypothetical protein
MLHWPNADGVFNEAVGLEPVELKNHAPFAVVGKSLQSRARGNYLIKDPGCAESVAVWHLPQLYLHMLCTVPPLALGNQPWLYLHMLCTVPPLALGNQP